MSGVLKFLVGTIVVLVLGGIGLTIFISYLAHKIGQGQHRDELERLNHERHDNEDR